MPTTERIQCPICGKTYEVNVVYKTKEYYLDTMPKRNVKQTLASYVICDCGMLCFNNAHQIYRFQEMVAAETYQNILQRSDIHDDVKKMMLMQAGLFDTTIPLMMAHYYYEQKMPEKRSEALEVALQMVLSGQDKANKQLSGMAMPALKINRHNLFMGTWFYTPEHKQIDLLRQLSRFQEAEALLTQLSHDPKALPAEQKFFEIEQKLISKQDNTPQ